MKRHIVLLTLFITVSNLFLSKGNTIRFKQNADGLSNSSVTYIFQDSKERMWFGTYDGLNMYNGQNFTIWRPIFNDSTSISHHIIRNIAEDRSGQIWISTDQGVNRLDVDKNEYKRFFQDSHKQTQYPFIAIDKDGRIFFSFFEGGLFYYDIQTKEFKPLIIPDVNTSYIHNLFADVYGNLWIHTSEGCLYRLKFSAEEETRYVPAEVVQVFNGIQPSTLFNQTFYYYKDNFIWYFDNTNSLIRYDIALNKSVSIYNINSLIKSHGNVSCMSVKDNKVDIAFSGSGILHLTLAVTNVVDSEWMFTEFLANYLFHGTQNIYWIGTDSSGLIMLYTQGHKFTNILNSSIPHFTNKAIRTICTDQNGNLLVGTKGDGLYVFRNFNKDKTPAYTSIEKIGAAQGFPETKIYSLFKHSDGSILVGTEGSGLYVLTPDLKRTQHLIPNHYTHNETDRMEAIYCIAPSEDGSFWLGTSYFGLINLNIRKKNDLWEICDFKQYLKGKNNSISHNTVYAIAEENDSILWVGTRGVGLNRFNKKTGEFQAFKEDPRNKASLSSNDILSLYMTSQKTLWIGTSVGLNKLKSYANHKAQFSIYTQQNGLPNNTIHGILCDKNENLWLSTGAGLCRFDSQQETFSIFNRGSGLLNEEFSDNAFFNDTQDNLLYFGGIDGFISFNPEDIKSKNYTPKVILSRLKINNKPTPFTEVYDREASTPTIVLNHNQNFFDISFVAIDYINSSNINYKYFLENFSNEWVDNKKNSTAIFTNVPPGKYMLNVKCSNDNSIYSDDVLTLTIIIKSPWWQTTPAYLLYAILSLAICFVIFKIIRNRMRLKNEVWKEKLNREKEEEIHQSKLRFFTNIAHEFSNSLALIYGPCERLLEVCGNNLYEKKYLNTIISNAERMNNLIKELVEFRKTETGYFSINRQYIDIEELVQLTDNFSEMAEHKGCTFTVSTSLEAETCFTDKNCIEKVMFNLISNAFKYTPDGGRIEVQINTTSSELVIRVSNEGKGIKQEEIPFIFDRFRILDNYEKRASEGNVSRHGIGLAICYNVVQLLNGQIAVESNENEWTTFAVSFPLTENEPTAETELPLKVELRPDKDSETKVVRKPIRIEALTVDANKQTILILDDETGIIELLTDTLHAHYNILSAQNGVEGLEIIKQKLPDAIICDVKMPEMDGYTFIHKVRQNSIICHIPIILLSSKITTEEQIQGLEYGADMYITKPFSTRHILTSVQRLLENRDKYKEYLNSPIQMTTYYEGKAISTDDKEFLEKLKVVIEANLSNEALSPEFIYTQLGLSRMQLYRKTKEILQVAPSDYIRSIRISHAAKLLTTTTMSAQEIMFDSGFSNKATFYREFGRIYHCTPIEFRNRTALKSGHNNQESTE